MDRQGYVRLKGLGRAHRVFYEAANEPLGKGRKLYHSCGHRWCVNVEHIGPHSSRLMDENGLRKCSSCGEAKPDSGYSFRKNRKGKHYASTECRACAMKRRDLWRKNNPEKFKTQVRATDKRRKALIDLGRKRLAEAPLTLSTNREKLAWMRGYMAKSELWEEGRKVEQYQDLVFRIAGDLERRYGSIDSRLRLTYEECVSAGMETLLELARKGTLKSRPYIAAAIRLRIKDAARLKFGRKMEKRDVIGVSIDTPIGESGESMAQHIKDARVKPGAGVSDLEALLAKQKDLSARDYFILTQYAQGVGYRGIGATLGISESRVVQLARGIRERVPELESALLAQL